MRIDKDELVEQYYPIVRRMVRKLVVRMPDGYDEEDFVQVGMMGLLKAIEAFDHSKSPAEFKSYASLKIRGAILDKLRSVDRVSRYGRDKLKRISEAYRQLMDEGVFNPSDESVAEKAGMGLDEFNRVLTANSNLDMLSLDEVLSDGDMLVIEAIENRMAKTPSKELEEKEKEELIKEALGKLSELELTVLSLYYYEDLNIRQIASVIGKTESRVSQIKTKALMKIRQYVKRRLEE